MAAKTPRIATLPAAGLSELQYRTIPRAGTVRPVDSPEARAERLQSTSYRTGVNSDGALFRERTSSGL